MARSENEPIVRLRMPPVIDSGVSFSPPQSTSAGPEAQVQFAIGRITNLQSRLATQQMALASIQEVIAALRADLSTLTPPDPDAHRRSETRDDGTTAQVLDTTSFNRAMSRHLARVQSLESQIQSKENELAQKEQSIATVELALSDAEQQLNEAQARLEQSLARDQQALQEAQRRHQEQLARIRELQAEALRAQAQAQQAQNELNEATEQLTDLTDAALTLGGYSLREREELLEELRDWEPESFEDSGPYATASDVDERAIEAFENDSQTSYRALRAAVSNAGNSLPTAQGDTLMPPVDQVSARDFVALAPELASFEEGLRSTDTGLLVDIEQNPDAAEQPELERLVALWDSAGFSPRQIEAELVAMKVTSVDALVDSIRVPGVDEAVQTVLKAANDFDGAAVLATELARGDDEFAAAVITELAEQNPDTLTLLLTGAAGDHNIQWPAISDDQRQVVANAVGSAYESVEDPDALMDALMVHKPNAVAALIARAETSTELKIDFARTALTEAQNYDPDLQYGDTLYAAAIRAISQDTQAMATVLNPGPDGLIAGQPLANILYRASNAWTVRTDSYNSMPNPVDLLYEGAAGLPPSAHDLVLNLFELGVNGADSTGRFVNNDSVARLFLGHPDYIAGEMLDQYDDNRSNNIVTLSTFFARTAFSRRGGEADAVLGAVVDLANSYADAGDFRRAGELAGTIQNGFVIAVEDLERRGAAVRGFVDLVVGLVPFGKVGAVVSGSLGEQLSDQVTRHLTKELTDDVMNALKEDLSSYLTDQLTAQNGFLLWTDQSISSRNDLDALLRRMFGVVYYDDFNEEQVRNQSIDEFDDGLDFAHGALEGR